METRQQRLLREALGHDSDTGHRDSDSDNHGQKDAKPEASLQDKSLQRTDPDYVPRTLTPHEWELFYAEHGVPAAHRRVQRQPDRSGEAGSTGVLQRLKRFFGSTRG